MRVWAAGYDDIEVPDVTVSGNEPTLLNVKMKRSAIDDPEIELPIYHVFGHHNYTQMEARLKEITQAYPAITRLYTIGQTVQGRELYVSFLIL